MFPSIPQRLWLPASGLVLAAGNDEARQVIKSVNA